MRPQCHQWCPWYIALGMCPEILRNLALRASRLYSPIKQMNSLYSGQGLFYTLEQMQQSRLGSRAGPGCSGALGRLMTWPPFRMISPNICPTLIWRLSAVWEEEVRPIAGSAAGQSSRLWAALLPALKFCTSLRNKRRLDTINSSLKCS